MTKHIPSYDGENWKTTNNYQYSYRDAANMALYQGQPVMIGVSDYSDYSPSDFRSNVSYFEAFDPETEQWSDLKRNPFFPELAYEYSSGTSVTKEDSFLVFGGYVNSHDAELSEDFWQVIEYKNDQWTNLGLTVKNDFQFLVKKSRDFRKISKTKK